MGRAGRLGAGDARRGTAQLRGARDRARSPDARWATRGTTRGSRVSDRGARRQTCRLWGDSSALAATDLLCRHLRSKTWEETRMPLLPADFDQRFHVCVPEDQWSSSPLRSDEPIEVLGVTPEGLFSCQLPRIAPGFSSVISGQRKDYRTHLDTILVDVMARRVELTWRAAIPLPKKLEMVQRISVVEKEVHLGSACARSTQMGGEG
ncbi:MAG: DUF2169 domain-containing protein [Polyangiaceae bacterium]